MYGSFSELNKMVYLHNVKNNVDKKMNNFHFANGLNLVAGLKAEKLGLEIRWHNYHTNKSSEFVDNGKNYKQDLKFKWNSFDFNFTYGDRVIVGYGFNYGKLRFYGKKYLISDSEPDYENLSTDSKGSSKLSSSLGFNLFGEVPLGKFLRLRLSYFNNFSTHSLKVRSFLNTGLQGIFAPKIKINTLSLDLILRFGGNN